jgi:hypothetical protein
VIELAHASSQYLQSDSSWTIPDGGTLCFWYTQSVTPGGGDLRFPIRHTPNFYLRLNELNLETCCYRSSNQRTYIGTELVVGQRTHIAVQWYETSKEYNEAFYNGVSVGSGNKNRAVPASNPTYVGWDLVSSYLDGAVEDLRFYNRLLSVVELQTIHACDGLDGIYDGLLHRWMALGLSKT